MNWIGRRVVTAVTLASACVLAACGHAQRGGQLPLRLVRDVPLPGGTSRFDYQDIDPTRRRLFIAHLGASQVDVVDLDSLQVVRTLTGLPDVHGVRVAPGLARLYVSATGDNQLVTFDEDSLTVLNRTPTGSYPDGIAFDAAHAQVFVSNEHGDSETVIDAHTATLMATVPLDGEAGNVAVDPTANQVLVDVQTRNEVVTIDPTTRHLSQTLPLEGCNNDHSLLIDDPARLAFITCDGNNVLLVLDRSNGKILVRAPVGDGPDVLALDQQLNRLYVASESGIVTVFAIEQRTVRQLGQAHLAAHAHSVAVDPTTHRAFFPLQSVGGRPVLRIMAPT